MRVGGAPPHEGTRHHQDSKGPQAGIARLLPPFPCSSFFRGQTQADHLRGYPRLETIK